MLSVLADLDRYAASSADSVALVTPEKLYTFAELKTVVDAAASQLRAEGVVPRAVVALDLPSAHEWILDLALMRLAARSVSLGGVAEIGRFAPDVLIAAPGGRELPVPLVIRIDEGWFSRAVAAASGPAPFVDFARPDSIFRLMLTSGTTGTPRAAAYSVAALDHRRLDQYWTDGRSELNFMPLSTTGGLHTAVANLRHGQAHRAVDFINANTLRFAATEAVQVLCGSPMHIAAALAVLAEHRISLPALKEIRMAGAAPSATLLRRIDETLGVPVRSVYGSTEGGGVTMRMLHPDDDLANVGPALPGQELQIVDDDGKPVPAETEGFVRYRGPGLVSGYLVDGALQSFSRGWFEPGDVGRLCHDGSLVLGGRTSEVLNIAGMKIDPARVDELALTFPGVRDAAAFGFERENGIAELGLAVVPEPGCDLRELDRALRQQLARGFPTAYWQVDEVPRNRMGKAERGTLAENFMRRQTRAPGELT